MTIEKKLKQLRDAGSVAIDKALSRQYASDQDVADGAVPAAVIYPKSTSDVQGLVKWANVEQVPLTVVSSATGPRRRGDTVPTKEGVLVDLSKMASVRFIDRKDKMAIIEPGVTFDQLDKTLRGHGLRSYRTLRPRAGKSVIASYLEREPIMCVRDHWDLVDPLGGLEIIMGGGELFRTGGAAWGEDLDTILDKGMRPTSALGPLATDYTRVLQGSQGTLGIVTWATVMCEDIPALEKAYLVATDNLQNLCKLSARLSAARSGSNLFIIDKQRLAALGVQTDPAMPGWVLYVNLAAPDYFPVKRLAYETADLKLYAEELGLTVSEEIAGITADSVTEAINHSTDSDYKADHRGSYEEVFFRNQATNATHFEQLVNSILNKHEIAREDVSTYLQPGVQGVNCYFEYSIHCDSSRTRREKARIVRDELSELMMDNGAFFDRPYGNWSSMVYKRDTQIVQSLQLVKNMMDPNRILNPGKLCY